MAVKSQPRSHSLDPTAGREDAPPRTHLRCCRDRRSGTPASLAGGVAVDPHLDTRKGRRRFRRACGHEEGRVSATRPRIVGALVPLRFVALADLLVQLAHLLDDVPPLLGRGIRPDILEDALGRHQRG